MSSLENFLSLDVNINVICRICLKKSEELVSVFNKIKMIGTTEEELISSILYALTEISVRIRILSVRHVIFVC